MLDFIEKIDRETTKLDNGEAVLFKTFFFNRLNVRDLESDSFY